MIGVAGQAVADDLAIDAGAARQSVLALLDHDDAGALAHDEAVAVAVIRARGRGRPVVEMGGQRLGGCEAGNGDAADGRFRTAGDHHVGIAEGNQPGRIADGVRAGGTGGDHGMVRPLEAVADRHVAGGEVDQATGNEERADPPRAAVAQRDRGFLDALQAADARADEHAGRHLIVMAHRMPAGVFQRLVGGGHRIDDERIDLAAFLRLHPVVGIELAVRLGAARQLAGDLAGQVANLEILDPGNAALAGEDRRPRDIDAAAKRRHHAHPGDDSPSHGTL